MQGGKAAKQNKKDSNRKSARRQKWEVGERNDLDMALKTFYYFISKTWLADIT